MKTTDILKKMQVLPLVALLAASVASCGSEVFDSWAQRLESMTGENTKDYIIPATVNATLAEVADTRTAYDPSATGCPISFETDDILFVSGKTADGVEFAGLLPYVSGKFTGDLSVSVPYAGTVEELFQKASSNKSIDAYLLPKGYEAQGWMSVVGEGSTRKISFDQTKRFCSNLASAVAQLSTEHATVYDNGFSLSPECAIIDCTLKNMAACFAAVEQVTVTFCYTASGKDMELTGVMAPTSNFAFAIDASQQALSIKDVYITITGGAKQEYVLLDDKSIINGKIYKINKSIQMPAIIVFLNREVTKTLGDEPFTQAVENSSDGVVTYSSSDTGVATVDANTGTVTILAPGSTKITAKVANTEEHSYVINQDSYTLTVNKKSGSISYAITAIDKFADEDNFANELTLVGDGAVTYTSSDKKVATVDANGIVTLVSDGTTTITATVSDSGTYTYATKTASYTLTVGMHEGKISYAITSVAKKVDDPAFTNELTNTGTGKVTYTSSDTNVATVNTSGKVTIKAAGSTSITATVSDSKGYNYTTKTASYSLVVSKYAGSISYATTSITKKVDDAAFTNELTKTGDGTVTYTSSDTNVATVDANGKVTIKGAGSTSITATVSDSEKYTYATKTASYTLTVGKYAGTISYATTSISKKVGDAAFTNELTNTGTGKVTYTSSNTSVATVDANGMVTIKADGSTTITATVADNEVYTYATKTASYTLTVGKEAASISFAVTSITKQMGDAAFTNELTNTGDGTVSYKSSNTNVAKVDATGKVTLTGTGSATITATVSDGPVYSYAKKQASYTITVKSDVSPDIDFNNETGNWENENW